MARKQLFAVGLILIGLGVPRWVDAVEIAYTLDIRRDVGVLPWYLVTALGAVLFLWHSIRSRRPAARRRPAFGALFRALAHGLAAVLVAFAGILLLGRDLVDQLLASGTQPTWLAIRGLVLFAAGVGVVIASAARGSKE